MKDSGVAFKLETPVWMDANRDQCAEQWTSSYKITHSLTYPDMCFVVDEVGGNTSQKVEGYTGGRLIVYGKGMVPQNNINAKEKK